MLKQILMLPSGWVEGIYNTKIHVWKPADYPDTPDMEWLYWVPLHEVEKFYRELSNLTYYYSTRAQGEDSMDFADSALILMVQLKPYISDNRVLIDNIFNDVLESYKEAYDQHLTQPYSLDRDKRNKIIDEAEKFLASLDNTPGGIMGHYNTLVQ